MLSSLSAALLGLSVSLNSLPVSNENAPGRTAESKPAYGALEVTGETKREENLKVSAEEYTDLFHVEDLPQIERLDLRAEHFLVAHPDALAPGAEADRVEIRVDRRNQTMTVLLNGKEKWSGWKVSTGVGKFETHAGSFEPTELSRTYYSREIGVVLPFAIRFDGNNLIHAVGPGGETFLGEKRSHGAIRLHPSSAKLLYSLVEQVGAKHTKILVQ